MFEINNKYKIFLKNKLYLELKIVEVDNTLLKGIDPKGQTRIVNIQEISDCTLIE